jgi:hypothetical protein
MEPVHSGPHCRGQFRAGLARAAEGERDAGQRLRYVRELTAGGDLEAVGVPGYGAEIAASGLALTA